MSSKLIPSNPEEVMVIREIVPGVTTLSVPFLRFGLIKFGGRATIGILPSPKYCIIKLYLTSDPVKMSSGALAVFSPVALTPTVQSTITSLGGRVSYIAAPDLEHHIFLSSWSSAFPSAKILAPEGLAAKRATMSKTDSSVTAVPIHTTFSASTKSSVTVDAEFDADFEYEYVDAHPNKEIVFFHKPTRTLIQADLLFNLPATEQYSKTGIDPATGWATRIFGAIGNTRGDAKWQRRVSWYGNSKADREGYNKSMQRIAGWGFENLVPCHGDTILGEGKEVFERVFAWHLKGKN